MQQRALFLHEVASEMATFRGVMRLEARDGRKFVEKASALSDKKPLIVLKSGKGSSGQAAAYSHTGRLAGRYEVFRSILKQFGIRELSDFDEFIDAAKALSYQKPSPGNRILIVTNGGGSGVLAADECIGALGTDTGGSIRQPAACCGVVGMNLLMVARQHITCISIISQQH
jgi:hypothetical protein